MVPIEYNLRSLAVRKRTTGAAVAGIALVVFVMASSMMLSDGLKKTMAAGGHAENAIVLRKGSDAELSSGIAEAQVGLVLAAPGVKRDAKNMPIGVGEVVVVSAIEKIGADGGISNVVIRGVTDNVVEFRPEVKIVAGRMPKPGTDEVMVGDSIRGRFVGLDLNQKFDIKKNRPVTVVGIFSANGSSFESEVWADRDTVRSSFGREGMVSSVWVRLESPTKYEAFETVVEQDKMLGLEAQREDRFFESQSEGTAKFINGLGMAISFFFSIGAMIGAMITMYALVANRSREIGTLRALGFSKASILFSFLLESMLLAVTGGVIGAAASLGMQAVKFSMVNMVSWSEIVFTFTPTVEIMAIALLFAAMMGFLGGFFPAVRAARVSPIRAMRG